MNNFIQYWRALTFATQYYNGLTRKSKKIPYVVHPLRVAIILRAAGFNEFDNPEILIAALFHDLIEDTEITKEIIESKFGKRISTIVGELSKNPNQTKENYLKSLKNVSKEAQIIKMADRIDNLLDMDISNWDRAKKEKYAKHGELILEICGNSNLKLSKKLSEVIKDVLENL